MDFLAINLFQMTFLDFIFVHYTIITTLKYQVVSYIRDRSGSMGECLTRDQGFAGSSLTGITVLCP